MAVLSSGERACSPPMMVTVALGLARRLSSVSTSGVSLLCGVNSTGLGWPDVKRFAAVIASGNCSPEANKMVSWL